MICNFRFCAAGHVWQPDSLLRNFYRLINLLTGCQLINPVNIGFRELAVVLAGKKSLGRQPCSVKTSRMADGLCL
jgi:hypothetical protein